MTTPFPVRLLFRLVGRDEAHSSKNDEMRVVSMRDRLTVAALSDGMAAGIDIDPDALVEAVRCCDHFPECSHTLAFFEEHGHDFARPARALTPGSPGDVQKGERT